MCLGATVWVSLAKIFSPKHSTVSHYRKLYLFLSLLLHGTDPGFRMIKKKGPGHRKSTCMLLHAGKICMNTYFFHDHIVSVISTYLPFHRGTSGVTLKCCLQPLLIGGLPLRIELHLLACCIGSHILPLICYVDRRLMQIYSLLFENLQFFKFALYNKVPSKCFPLSACQVLSNYSISNYFYRNAQLLLLSPTEMCQLHFTGFIV